MFRCREFLVSIGGGGDRIGWIGSLVFLVLRLSRCGNCRREIEGRGRLFLLLWSRGFERWKSMICILGCFGLICRGGLCLLGIRNIKCTGKNLCLIVLCWLDLWEWSMLVWRWCLVFLFYFLKILAKYKL